MYVGNRMLHEHGLWMLSVPELSIQRGIYDHVFILKVMSFQSVILAHISLVRVDQIRLFGVTE